MSEQSLDFTLDPLPQADVPVRLLSRLKMSDEKREELERYCSERIGELSEEMGLDSAGKIIGMDSWMGKRSMHQDLFDGNNDWRKSKYHGIFDSSNLSLGIAQRMARETHAKCGDDLLGTRPFFAAVGTDTGDDATARAVEELIQQRVDRSDIQIDLRSALRSAIVRNDAVVKIRYTKRASTYFGPATVMVDPQTQEPVITPNGLYIFQNDDFIDDPNVEGTVRLKKDPLFAMIPGQFAYAEIPDLKQELIGYEGVEVRELDFRSFLCPLQSPSIDEADFCCQLYDDTPNGIRSAYGTYDGFDEYSKRSEETSGERQAKTTHGETDDKRSALDIRRRMAECYVRFDADGDGEEEEIFAVFDRTCGKLVFAEYLGNIMGRRPFVCIPGLGKISNRWYGEGVVQAVIDQDTYICAQFNRLNMKDSRENSIDFYDPMAVKEWKNGSAPEYGRATPYEVEPGFTAERPPLWRVNLMEKCDLSIEMMHEAMQQVNLAFGIVSAKDVSNTGANQSRTATGILNIERTANLLVKNSEVQQQQAVLRVMEQVVTLVLENLNETELLITKDGKKLLTINREEARTIHREIRLLLTRSRSSELLSTSEAAIMRAKDYWLAKAQDPVMARHLRPEYLRQLKALEVPDPDELCPPITDQEIAAWQQMQQANAKEQAKQQARSLMNYKDTPPSVQEQIEAEWGFTPAPPEERHETQEVLHPEKEGGDSIPNLRVAK